MAQFKFDSKDLNKIREAVARNPKKVITEVGKFLQRGMAAYKRIINNNPWRIGDTGGGVPVATGHLRDTHQTQITAWTARIFPTAPYAAYVHGIDGYPRRKNYQLRPWLDFAVVKGESEIKKLEGDMLDEIVGDLAA